jgi:AcrR family transcriptional regulator
MRARAEAAAETGRRILRAVLELHTERFHDEITLEDVAERAGVTAQTVIRRFGSRDGLISAAGEYAKTQVLRQRSAAPIGDVDGAVESLIEHYEELGASVLRLLAQEDRVPQLRAIADRGRALHYAWVDRTFEPFLVGRSKRLLRATLITLTDVYVWKLLRLDLGLNRTETATVIGDMIRGAALAHGLPLLCLPIGRDQPDNAARVVWRGAGLRISPKSSPARIAAALEKVLHDEGLKRSARDLARAIVAERPADVGPSEIERLAATGAESRTLVGAALAPEPG